MKVYFIVLGSSIATCRCRLVEREGLGGRMIGALLAEGRIVRPAHARRQPHAALLVEHGVVVVGARVPDASGRPSRPRAASA